MIILGSKSKPRYQLLRMYNAEIEVVVADIAEEFDDNLSLEDNLKLVALKKAQAILKKRELNDNILICADTIVALDDEILLKPVSYEDAFTMIKKLSNKTIRVLSGVYLKFNNHEENFCEESTITFKEINTEIIKEYLSKVTNYLDISGALDIDQIKDYVDYTYEGSYTNIIGLPMERISSILYDHNLLREVEYSSSELEDITIYRSSVRNLIFEENQVYLLKGYTFDYQHTYYTTIGGGYHFFEDKLAILKKETAEEAGLIVDDFQELIKMKEYTHLKGYISYNKLTLHNYFLSKVKGQTNHHYVEYEAELIIGIEKFNLDEAIELIKKQQQFFNSLEYPIKVISECDLKALEKAYQLLYNR